MSELAEELADLVSALRDAATEHTAVAEALRGTAAEQPGHAAECRACPVCQGLALLRQTRPEAFEHLAVAVDALAMAARALVSPSGSTDRTTSPRPSPGRSGSPTGPGSPSSSPPEPPHPRVERIEIEP